MGVVMGLFKAKAVKEVDTERERATPEEVSAEEVSDKTLVMVQTREISPTSSLATPVSPLPYRPLQNVRYFYPRFKVGSTGNICLAAAIVPTIILAAATPPALGGGSCYYYVWRSVESQDLAGAQGLKLRALPPCDVAHRRVVMQCHSIEWTNHDHGILFVKRQMAKP
jgi:hypothetical protein